MTEDIWIEIIATVASTVLLGIVVAVLRRGRSQPTTASARILETSRASRVIAAICLSVFLVPAGAVLFVPKAPIMMSAILGAVSLPFAWMVLGEWRFRIEVTRDGLLVRHRLGGRSSILWSDITWVRWGIFRQAFVLKTRDRRTVVIEATLRGLPFFAERLLAGVPSERIAPKAMSLLIDTAHGNLPEISCG